MHGNITQRSNIQNGFGGNSWKRSNKHDYFIVMINEVFLRNVCKYKSPGKGAFKV